MPEIAVFSESLEENAMVQYKGRQTMAVIKGIEDNFEDLTAIDSILFGRGQFVLHDEVVDYAIPGIELVSILGTGIKFLDPLEIYAPKRGVKVNILPPFPFAFRLLGRLQSGAELHDSRQTLMYIYNSVG